MSDQQNIPLRVLLAIAEPSIAVLIPKPKKIITCAERNCIDRH